MTRPDTASTNGRQSDTYCPVCGIENCETPTSVDAYDWMTMRALRHLQADLPGAFNPSILG